MAINLTKIAKKIDLDLRDIPISDRKKAKKEVGDFVVDEILRSVSSGKSPVSGEIKFKKLNKKYAKDMKGGNTNPNLELDGDMLDSLTSKNLKGNSIEVGIFKSDEVPKADGHNNFSGMSKLPKRRFIPEEDQRFKRNIEKGINDILDDFRVTPTKKIDPFAALVTIEESEFRTEIIEVSDLFTSESFIDELLRES